MTRLKDKAQMEAQWSSRGVHNPCHLNAWGLRDDRGAYRGGPTFLTTKACPRNPSNAKWPLPVPKWYRERCKGLKNGPELIKAYGITYTAAEKKDRRYMDALTWEKQKPKKDEELSEWDSLK